MGECQERVDQAFQPDRRFLDSGFYFMGARMDSSTRYVRPRYVAALVVTTALTALGSSAEAATQKAVQDLSRYCTACWRNARLQPDAWPDCTQEVFRRLLERVTPERWGRVLAKETEERQEFLRAIDAVKKRVQRAHRPTPLTQEVADDRANHRHQVAEQRRAVLDAARRHLSPRQERVIALSFDGWSVQEIARKLDLSTARVSDEKYKAIRRLQKLNHG
jgi:RNA polymerase sigma factor (sigma-70 family)